MTDVVRRGAVHIQGWELIPVARLLRWVRVDNV